MENNLKWTIDNLMKTDNEYRHRKELHKSPPLFSLWDGEDSTLLLSVELTESTTRDLLIEIEDSLNDDTKDSLFFDINNKELKLSLDRTNKNKLYNKLTEVQKAYGGYIYKIDKKEPVLNKIKNIPKNFKEKPFIYIYILFILILVILIRILR